MININTQLGMRLRYLRKQRKLSQEELAFKADINKNYYSDLERGNRNPTLTILNKLAIAFDITLEELLKGIVEYIE